MTTKHYEHIGGIWLPERSTSFAGKATAPQRVGIVVAVQRRPRWAIEDLAKPDRIRALLEEELRELDPAKLLSETIWASVTANERVDDGAALQHNRTLGTVGASNGVANVIAVANATLVKTKTDSSLGVDAASLTTNEFTTIGLARAVGTVQNYVAPSTLNGVASADVVKTFTASGSGTARGSGLFDSTTVSGSKLYVEDNFSSDAVLVSGDTLQITWTITM